MGKPRAEVERVVKQVLQEFVGAGHAVGTNDKPISGLGLTSLDGVDFACELEKHLGCSIPSKSNPFVTDGKGGERNVSQIVEFVSTLCSAGGEKP
jgi:acyl carrier protein